MPYYGLTFTKNTLRDLDITRAYVTSKKTHSELGLEYDLCKQRIREIIQSQRRRMNFPDFRQEDDLYLENPGDLRLKPRQTLRRLDRLEQALLAIPSPALTVDNKAAAMIAYYSTEDGEIFEHEVSDGSWIYRPAEQRSIIEACAEDYFSNHDGWEDRWPIEFRLHHPTTKKVIVRLNVEIHSDPVFTATIVKA